jgi:hypothetical protein
MFHHVVLLRLANADAAFHARVDEYARRMPLEVRGIESYACGRNVADRGMGYDWAVIGVFESSAAHDAYQVSPLHQELKAFMTPHIAGIVVCDLDTSER